MTANERMIIRAVLRYNGVPDADHAAHMALIVSNGTYLYRQAYANYRIIFNSFTNAQKRKLTSNHCRVTH